jgi:DNA anti-recombination protein RmuC
MSIYHDAADAIRRAAKQHEIYVAAAALLERAGSFEQAAQEAELRSARANEALVQHEGALRQARERLQELQAQADEMVEAANERAKAIAKDALVRADALMNDAEARAKEAVAKIEEAGVARAAELRQEAETLAEQVEVGQGRVRALGEEIAAKQAKVDELNAAIAGLREKLGV